MLIKAPIVWTREWFLSAECGKYLDGQRKRLACELWELRDEWPHRERQRAMKGKQ